MVHRRQVLFGSVLALVIIFIMNISCSAQQSTCAYSFSPTTATLAADPANDDSTVTFTVIASAPSCTYGIFIPFGVDYDTSDLNIQPGTQTYTLSNEYPPPIGCCNSQNNIIVGSFGPVKLGVFPAFSGSVAILPVLDPVQADPNDPGTKPSSLQAVTFALPNSVNGQPYAPFQLQASGGSPPYTWMCSGCTGNSSDGPSDTPLIIDTSGNVTKSTTFVDESSPQVTQLYPVLFSIQLYLEDADGTQIPVFVSFANYPAGYAPPPSVPAAPTMLDPSNIAATGASPLQLSGDRHLLTTGGRQVQGIAADGTAELLLRMPVFAAGDAVSVTVLSDQCTDPSQPSTCAVSTSSAHDGGVFTLSQATRPSSAAATALDTADDNKFAYVIYQAPNDFVRSGFMNDPQLVARTIQFQVNYSSNGTAYGPQYVPLTIVRPPLILLHGYAANSGTWDHFGQIKNDPRATVFMPNYGDPITVVKTEPQLGCVAGICQTTFRKSDLGFTYNVHYVAQDVVSDLADFASGNNPATPTGTPVAVSQVDIVAHSMGGLVARYWTTDPPTASFLSPNNYEAGYIHKLVTLGTPHYGTPFAAAALYPEASCFRFASAAPRFTSLTASLARYEIGTATLLDGSQANGAVGELSGDGSGEHMNDSLNLIKDTAVPVWLATIGGEAHPAQVGLYTTIRGFCLPFHPNDPVASRFMQSQYNNLFDPALFSNEAGSDPPQPNLNDGVVPINSALFGHLCVQSTVPNADNCFDGYAHGLGTAELINNVASGTLLNPLPNLVDGTLQNFIESVLNTSVEDTSVWSKR